MSKFILTSEKVDNLFRKCLSKTIEDNEGYTVTGVRISCRFDRDKLFEYKMDIITLLNELPDNFHIDSGGGWSFLNICVDKLGRQWAGSHRICDELVCLGIGIGAIKFSLPERDLWEIFPGGMPYITINTIEL